MALSPIDLTNVAAGVGGFAIFGRDIGDNSGFSVASAGDINGDGFDDLIVGAWLGDAAGNAKVDAGESYVVFGKAGGFGASIDLSTIAAGIGGFVINGQDAGDRSGFSVASAGDINGDGFDDLIIGADRADAAGNAKSYAGESYVVFGHGGGFGASLDLTDVAAGTGGFVIYGQNSRDYAANVASAGDINGDGFDDLVIGAPGGDGAANSESYAGESYVVFGKADGFGASVDLTSVAAGTGGFVIYGQDYSDYAAYVASAGDVNGDGLADLIIGAPGGRAAGNAKALAGESYVIFGRVGGFGASIDLSTVASGTGGFVIYGQDAGDFSGWSVASVGDINGDGFDDVLIGARTGDAAGNAKSNAGESYVVFGKASGFGASIDLSTVALGTGGFVIYGQDAGDFSGYSVASAGDINGDGLDDLIIGAKNAGASGNVKPNAGDSYVVFGKMAGFGPSIDLTDVAAGIGGFVIYGRHASDNSGRSVAAAGDIDGDGFGDLTIGAPNGDAAGTIGANVGESYVLFGEDFTGSVTDLGTTASETLTGSASADDMVGGQGNDTLIGNGGTDVLIGGSGDDVLRVSDLSFLRLDGGAGTDTIALSGSGLLLDLSKIANARLQNIEAIDLTGTGDNILVVSALEVLNLSSTSNTVKVDGNAGDTLSFGAETWANVGTTGSYTTYTLGQASVLASTAVTVACFVAGTRIRTACGDVVVEALREGDRAVTLSNEARVIRWIGHRRIDLTRHPDPKKVRPVRVRAGAIANGLPARDLLVSPDHALFLDGVLIPAGLLINGHMIVEEMGCRDVTYYHVELASHDIIMAEGLPTESYLDTGDRAQFFGGTVTALHPNFTTRMWEMAGCAPLVLTGHELAAVRLRLTERGHLVRQQVNKGDATRRKTQRPPRSPSAMASCESQFRNS